MMIRNPYAKRKPTSSSSSSSSTVRTVPVVQPQSRTASATTAPSATAAVQDSIERKRPFESNATTVDSLALVGLAQGDADAAPLNVDSAIDTNTTTDSYRGQDAKPVRLGEKNSSIPCPSAALASNHPESLCALTDISATAAAASTNTTTTSSTTMNSAAIAAAATTTTSNTNNSALSDDECICVGVVSTPPDDEYDNRHGSSFKQPSSTTSSSKRRRRSRSSQTSNSATKQQKSEDDDNECVFVGVQHTPPALVERKFGLSEAPPLDNDQDNDVILGSSASNTGTSTTTMQPKARPHGAAGNDTSNVAVARVTTANTSNGSSANANTVDNYFEDDGFDWDEAARVMDSAMTAHQAAAAETSSASTTSATSTAVAHSATAATCTAKATGAAIAAAVAATTTSATGSTKSLSHAKPPPPPPLATTNSSSNRQPPAIGAISDAIAAAKALPPSLQFDVIIAQQPVVDAYSYALIRHAAVTEALDNGWTLFAHQQQAILTALAKRRHILALDMGLGKTLIGCCWARAFCRAYQQVSGISVKVIVLCPVSLQKEWQRTALEATGLTVASAPAAARKVKRSPKKAKITTFFDEDDENASVNKRIKHKQSNSTEATNDRSDLDGQLIVASWGKVPTDCNGGDNPNQKYVVVADEAHSMQSMTAGRTQDALQLMLSKNAVGVLLLTGTPMKNGKPANLFPLLRAVQHPLGNDQRAYELHFCGGRMVQYGRGPSMWQASGAANLDQLRALTQSHLLHMTKETCLQELPPQTRVFKQVPVSSQSQLRHTAALQELAKIYNSSKNSNDQAVLGALQNLRKVDSLAKLDATVAVARVVLEKEPAVVVFTSFVDVAKSVHSKLQSAGWKGELLTGETPSQKRQGLVDNFQSGISPVFVCTYGAGGVGLTLTAAATVILLDRPWTPGDVHQAEDRVRRIGQTKPVTSIWMSAFELDKQIDSMIASKSQTASSVLSSTANSTPSTDSTSKLSIFKLLQAVLPPALPPPPAPGP